MSAPVGNQSIEHSDKYVARNIIGFFVGSIVRNVFSILLQYLLLVISPFNFYTNLAISYILTTIVALVVCNAICRTDPNFRKPGLIAFIVISIVASFGSIYTLPVELQIFPVLLGISCSIAIYAVVLFFHLFNAKKNRNSTVSSGASLNTTLKAKSDEDSMQSSGAYAPPTLQKEDVISGAERQKTISETTDVMVRPTSQFCIHCGASLPLESRFCPKCGTPVADEAKTEIAEPR